MKKFSDLKIIEGIPESVERRQADEPLILTYSKDGKNEEETFDLIVVLTEPKMSLEIKSLSKKFEQDIL